MHLHLTARFSGDCFRCAAKIHPGDRVVLLSGEGWRSVTHERCAIPETMTEAEIRGAILALDLHC